jgi:protein-tyrosine phosphatase
LEIEPFKIASLSVVGGGTIGVCRLPGRSGTLAADVALLAKWMPAVVVSLTELSEMVELGAAQLPSLLASHGVQWVHFSIRDFDVPTDVVAAEWPALSAWLHHALDQGQNVLLHCRGGLGRSGMVALRLMVERGEEEASALAHLRAVRPGAVETDAQMAWAGKLAK